MFQPVNHGSSRPSTAASDVTSLGRLYQVQAGIQRVCLCVCVEVRARARRIEGRTDRASLLL